MSEPEHIPEKHQKLATVWKKVISKYHKEAPGFYVTDDPDMFSGASINYATRLGQKNTIIVQESIPADKAEGLIAHELGHHDVNAKGKTGAHQLPYVAGGVISFFAMAAVSMHLATKYGSAAVQKLPEKVQKFVSKTLFVSPIVATFLMGKLSMTLTQKAYHLGGIKEEIAADNFAADLTSANKVIEGMEWVAEQKQVQALGAVEAASIKYRLHILRERAAKEKSNLLQ